TREDMLKDPHVAANGLIVESVHPQLGPMRQPRPAARFSGTPADLRRPVPTLGEDTDAVLAEIGIRGDELARLREAAIIA
ncbi:MAG: CoA transferase, partial [Candidatus Binataceae bacterium]